MEEINGKPISTHPHYSITRDGRVINSRNREKAVHDDRYGYPKVSLWENGRRTTKKVHRMVAEAFVPNPDNKPDVNHIDGNKHNNYFENLEWVTKSENMIHAYKTGLTKHNVNYGMLGRKNPNGGRKRRAVKVEETGEVFSSIAICAKALNIDERRVYECVKGTRKSYRGYHFALV